MMPPAPPGYERSAVSGTTIDDLDQEQLRAFLRRRAPNVETTPELLAEKLGLLTTSGSRLTPTVAGMLGFAPLPQLVRPEWGVVAVRVRGTQIADTIAQRLDIEGPLEALARQAVEFVHQQTATPERSEAAKVPALDYPEAAVKEAILNALIHRDYRLTGRTTIRIFDDRLEVWSPGGLPAQFSIDSVTEAGGISLPRNPVIAAMARVMGLVEQVGRGLPTIRRALAELTNQPCVMRSTTNDFLVSLPCYRGTVPSGPAN